MVPTATRARSPQPRAAPCARGLPAPLRPRKMPRCVRAGAAWGEAALEKASFHAILHEGWLSAPSWKPLLSLAGWSSPRHLGRRGMTGTVPLQARQAPGGQLSSS